MCHLISDIFISRFLFVKIVLILHLHLRQYYTKDITERITSTQNDEEIKSIWLWNCIMLFQFKITSINKQVILSLFSIVSVCKVATGWNIPQEVKNVHIWLVCGQAWIRWSGIISVKRSKTSSMNKVVYKPIILFRFPQNVLRAWITNDYQE